ncbi:MAG: BTAD domain-containing putative transcriptional regulator, partial [Chloroflexota bacterium]
MPRLDIQLLGAPRVLRDGVAIEVDTRKAIALIAYLALTQQHHSRDALATLLWPEYDQAHARAARRRTLSALNTALHGAGLEVERETIGLPPSSNIALDVHRFHEWLAQCATHGHAASDVCAACVAPLSEAAALYRDDFLAGFTLRDSPAFDEWQFFQTETLRRELASALERLVEHHSACSEWDSAITHARRWLALDPLHEPAHRQLMQLYLWAGQRAAALRQYRECVRVLEQELGVAPLAETTALYEAIKANAEVPRPTSDIQRPTSNVQSPITNHPTTQPPNYPLVGRASEWATVRGAYDAIRSDGRFVAIEGEAGIGKTRLAEELLAYAGARGATHIIARCYDGESQLAYAPFVEGLRALVADAAGARWLADVPAHVWNEVARLLPELATQREHVPPAAPLVNAGAQSRFFDAVHQFMRAACRGAAPTPSTSLRTGPPSHPALLPVHPVPQGEALPARDARGTGHGQAVTQGRETVGVLLLDDLQWADAASLDLLSYMVRRLRGQAWLIVATWRAEDVPSEHRLRQLLGEAQRAGTATALR